MRDARRRRKIRKCVRKPHRRVLGRTVTALLCVLAIIGGFIAIRPILLDAFERGQSLSVISDMSSTSDLTDDPARRTQLADAQAYNVRTGGEKAHIHNAQLGGGNGGKEDILDLSDEGKDDVSYDELLTWGDSPAMGWIEIPRIDVTLPIYHGTSDEVLAMGVGHLEGTSLPVGGVSTHCVLAAHSGMEQARMFDDLEFLDKGDAFYLHVLGDAYAYEIDAIDVVDPSEVPGRCGALADQDRCTLLTCTPYGVNSHRLLVQAHRVPCRAPEQRPWSTTTHALRSHRTAPARLLALSMLVLCTLSIATRRFRKKRW